MENIPYELIARYLAGECNDDEKQQVREWIEKHPETMDELSRIWQQIPSDEFTPNVELALQKVSHRIEEKKKVRSKRILMTIGSVAVAAVAAIMILISVIGDKSKETSLSSVTGSLLALATDEKETIEFNLPDGSKVWLNQSSVLRYPQEFAKETREVYLEGEAFFDISPNAEKPFIIHANNTQTRVVGTSFGVRAIKNESEVVVTVSTGIINFSTEGKSSHIELKPGEQGVCNPKQQILEKNINPDPNILAWKTKVLVFKQSQLTEVARVIEDVYQTPIAVDKSVAELQITSTFDQLSLEQIIRIIEITLQVKAEVNENGFLLTSK